MKKSFTLVEIVMIVIIVGVIATFALPAYRNVLEESKAEVCAMNLKVLLGAVETYAVENDALPSSLGQLNNRQLKQAWTKTLEKNNSWKVELAYWLVDFNQRGLAYAQEAKWAKKYIGDLKYFTCPANTETTISYGLNKELAEISYNDYRQRPKDTTTVVADADNTTFTSGSLAKRHKKHAITGTTYYAQEIKKNEKIEKPGLGLEQAPGLGLEQAPGQVQSQVHGEGWSQGAGGGQDHH